MTLASYVASFVIRLLIWILVFTDDTDSIGNHLLEFLVVLGMNLIILSLYYFTLEMEATKIILRSESHDKFKESIKRHRYKKNFLLLACILLQILQMLIVQVKTYHRDIGDLSYSTLFVIFNAIIRVVKMAEDSYIIGLFLTLFNYYV